MTIQAKVTLRYGLLVVFMVGVICTVNIAIEINQQFASTLQRATQFNQLATKTLTQALNADPSTPLQDVLAAPALRSMFEQIALNSKNTVLEISVLDQENRIMLDSILD